MDSIKKDLEIRADEINEFIDLIKFIEFNDKTTMCGVDNQTHEISDSLKNTLKGNVFLLLYNLIESIMKESISRIHDVISGREISFDDLREGFKREIIKRAKNINPDVLCKSVALCISRQILDASFQKDNIFSGNIDHKKICDQAKIYGFEIKMDHLEYSATKHGANLLIIKNKRNNLAHGDSSFSEIGRNYAVKELEEYSKEVINYLGVVTTHIADYLNQESYLAGKDV